MLKLRSDSMHCKTHIYTHTAVGLVFWLQGKQILLCRVRTKLNALTLMLFCYLTPTMRPGSEEMEN